jgi:hypothetical protein
MAVHEMSISQTAEMVSNYGLVKLFVGSLISVLATNITIVGIIIGIFVKMMLAQRESIKKELEIIIRKYNDEMFDRVGEDMDKVNSYTKALNEKRESNKERIIILEGRVDKVEAICETKRC